MRRLGRSALPAFLLIVALGVWAFPASWLPAGEESHASYTSAHTGPSPSQDDGHYWRSGVATTAVTAESV